jgi:predicted Ser/Thr protein kinase
MIESCPRCGSALPGGEMALCPRCLLQADLPGTLIGGAIALEEEIGRGGMGSVFRGHHVRLDRPVAVKFLPAELAADRDFQARFEREARILALLDHPNIVTVHDFGRDEGQWYIVMEHVDGAPLAAQVHLPERRAIEVARQVCAALAHAHARGVVHRDIKPENIFVCATRGGSLGRVKVLDFGISKIRRDAMRLDKNLTVSGTVVGTPRYMAPEQLTGSPVDARTDVYAFGVLLYEALAGKTPFDGDTFALVAAQKLNRPPRALHRVVNVDRGLSRIVMRALAIDPDKRFKSLEAFATALEAYSDVGFRTSGVPMPAGITTTDSATVFVEAPAERRVSRIAAVVAAIGGFLLLVGLGIALGAWIVNRSDRAPVAEVKYAPNKEAEPTVEPIAPEPVGVPELVSPGGPPAEAAPDESATPRQASAPEAPAPDEGQSPRSARGRTGRLTWDDF